MDLDGHYLVTKTAMEETRGKLSFFPAAADLAAVNRDLEDLTGGHWLPHGQKHHFMAVKGQTQEQAYASAMKWIEHHAEEAARMYIGGTGQSVMQGLCRADHLTSPTSRYGDAARIGGAIGSAPLKGQKIVPVEFPKRALEFNTMLCSGARPLGTAAHAVEDSFAPMHVQRSGGKITKIELYAEQDGHKHDATDRAWEETESKGFSRSGREAIEAVKDLFFMVDATVRSGQPKLKGWPEYVMKWFQPAFNGSNTPGVNVVPASAPVIKIPMQLTTAGPQHHQVKSGESLSNIAGHYYGDVLLWPVIYDANRQTVRDPNLIQPGWILNIPPSSTITDADKPALRERGRHWRNGR